jgi:hypothetical protein
LEEHDPLGFGEEIICGEAPPSEISERIIQQKEIKRPAREYLIHLTLL